MKNICDNCQKPTSEVGILWRYYKKRKKVYLCKNCHSHIIPQTRILPSNTISIKSRHSNKIKIPYGESGVRFLIDDASKAKLKSKLKAKGYGTLSEFFREKIREVMQ